MNFSFTEEQQAIKTLARDFAERELAPHVATWDREETFPRWVAEKLGKLGLSGGVLPEQYGGAEMDYVSLVGMIDELARVCNTSAVVAGWPSCSLGQGLLSYGTEEQKRRYLKPLAQGEQCGATGVTEPHSGTDVVRKMETTVRRDGDEYVINGVKTWTSNIHLADWLITFATMDKSLGHKGVCAFVVETGWPGVSVHPFKGKVGKRSLVSGEVVFDSVRVPAANLVGVEGEGYKVLMAGTEIGRMACATRALGVLRACLEASVKYALDRVVFGQPIAKYQLIQTKIADMVVAIEVGQNLLYRLAWLKDTGHERVQKDAAVAKLFVTDALMKGATEACQIHGAYSCSDEYPVGRYFRDAKFFQIIDGSNEICRTMIAEHALGYRRA